MQDTQNRQNSLETDNEDLQRYWTQMQSRILHDASFLYEKAIEMGIAKEQARALLPEGLTMSRMYMNGTLRSWLHYIAIRTDKATQKEHREVAEKCKHIIEELFPSLKDLLNAD